MGWRADESVCRFFGWRADEFVCACLLRLTALTCPHAHPLRLPRLVASNLPSVFIPWVHPPPHPIPQTPPSPAARAGSGVARASVDAVLPELLAAGQAARDAAGRQAQQSVAQCVAALCCSSGGGAAVSRF